MHELQVTEQILNIALKYADMNDVNRIISIELRVGEMSDLEDEWMQKYFDSLSEDTIAKGAKLKIEKTPVVMECDECAHSFQVNIREMKEILCPECSSKKCTLKSGREYYVKNMEVE